MRHIFAGQQKFDLFHALVETRDAFVKRDPESIVLVGQERPGKADFRTTARNRVQHADLAGQFQRVVEYRQDSPGHDPGVLGPLRCCRQENDRVGAVAAIGMEIVLNGSDMRVTIHIR